MKRRLIISSIVVFLLFVAHVVYPNIIKADEYKSKTFPSFEIIEKNFEKVGRSYAGHRKLEKIWGKYKAGEDVYLVVYSYTGAK